jgi:hypothetical protein
MLLDDLVVYDKFTRKLGKPGLGSDQYDTDSGVSHAVEMGRTLCGVAPGLERDGWFRNQYARSADASTVSCRRCRRSLSRRQFLRGTLSGRGPEVRSRVVVHAEVPGYTDTPGALGAEEGGGVMDCHYCALGWRIANPISGQRYGFIHAYPAGYRGLRAGVGPRCTAVALEKKEGE